MLFYYRKKYRSSNFKFRWLFISLGIAIFFLVAIFFLCVQEAGRVVCGNANNFQQLKKVKVLGQYLEFFPQSGKNFYYWCRRGNVSGVYEITEPEFKKWAGRKNWKLQEASGISETLEIPPSGTHDTFVQLTDGLYYHKQTIKQLESHREQIGYDFRIYFDRSKQKAYFSRWVD